MRRYSSFLIRCWLTDDGFHERQTVLQVEHIQTGASTRAESLSEAESWILEACRKLKSDAETASGPEMNGATNGEHQRRNSGGKAK